jgi:hypothetical protein
MLADIAQYYGVTTDSILGLSSDKTKNTMEEVYAAFKGLSYKEFIIKAFETVTSIIPATYGSIGDKGRKTDDLEEIYPETDHKYTRSKIAVNHFFEFTASSDDVNIAVMMLRNKANFSWMKDPDKQKKITGFFKFLADEDVISVIYFIHSESCSTNFTSEYIANNTGIKEDRICEILKELCALNICNCEKAFLEEGEITLYENFCDGITLSMITLAYERMCGSNAYSYNYQSACKMIGGKRDELI